MKMTRPWLTDLSVKPSVKHDAEQARSETFLAMPSADLKPMNDKLYSPGGVCKTDHLSRAEIADKLGVSREWVRQLERSALKKLKGQIDVQHAFDDYRQSGNW